MFYPTSEFAGHVAHTVRIHHAVTFEIMCRMFRHSRPISSADPAAMWAAWSEMHPEESRLRELVQVVRACSGLTFALLDDDTALAYSGPQTTLLVYPLSPRQDKEHPQLVSFRLADIRSLDFRTARLFVAHITPRNPDTDTPVRLSMESLLLSELAEAAEEAEFEDPQGIDV